MTVQPRAAPSHALVGPTTTAIQRGRHGAVAWDLPATGRQRHEPREVSRAQEHWAEPGDHRAAPSGDVRIDGYTLWAYSDVFKGLVVDIRM